ncbi:hypothetical protein WKI68_15515 [Streptomyces sp. MS1.HAVA.3]|uniref:Uncharacterized protein n=1 Tax=Streptomyces caledonius TaxID=3134107 RepID=A0ABU8U441_9ACTN
MLLAATGALTVVALGTVVSLAMDSSDEAPPAQVPAVSSTPTVSVPTTAPGTSGNDPAPEQPESAPPTESTAPGRASPRLRAARPPGPVPPAVLDAAEDPAVVHRFDPADEYGAVPDPDGDRRALADDHDSGDGHRHVPDHGPLNDHGLNDHGLNDDGSVLADGAVASGGPQGQNRRSLSSSMPRRAL